MNDSGEEEYWRERERQRQRAIPDNISKVVQLLEGINSRLEVIEDRLVKEDEYKNEMRERNE